MRKSNDDFLKYSLYFGVRVFFFLRSRVSSFRGSKEKINQSIIIPWSPRTHAPNTTTIDEKKEEKKHTINNERTHILLFLLLLFYFYYQLTKLTNVIYPHSSLYPHSASLFSYLLMWEAKSQVKKDEISRGLETFLIKLSIINHEVSIHEY